MGRIKSLMVKRASKQLIEKDHPFTEDFHHNKKALRNLMPSKPIRNKIAGYIARIMKMKARGPRPKKAPVISSDSQKFD